MRFPSAVGAASALFEDEYSFNPVEGLQYHVARDGRFLMIVENWLDELTRMAPGS